MKKIKKHFLAATLVLALGAAVYLNWSLSTTKPASRTLGESKYVNATLSTETTAAKSIDKKSSLSTENTTTSELKAKSTATTNNSNKTETKSTLKKNKLDSKLSAKEIAFFAQAETKRKQTQDEIIDKANEILELDSTSEKERTEAQLQIAGVIKNFTLQDTIESTLMAKGFSKALCYVNDQGCIVGVLKSELTESSKMIIKATVKSVTNIDFDKITIITV